MKAQLTKMLSKFEALQCDAEDLANSDNEKTAEKYEEVFPILSDIVDKINEALDALEQT